VFFQYLSLPKSQITYHQLYAEINLHSVPEAWTYVQFSQIFLANLSAESEHESFYLFFSLICMFSSIELPNQHKPAVGMYRSISNSPRKLELRVAYANAKFKSNGDETSLLQI
jgi:hypothetical protein